MDIVAQRLHIHSVSEQFQPTLLQMDSAVEVLEVDDQRDVHEQQKTALKEKKGRSAFVLEYQSKRVQAPGKAKKWPSVVDMATAKLMVPPGCTVWHGFTRRQWCGWCAPAQAKRISASWDMPGGEQAAVKHVCQRRWFQHCEVDALPLTEAPEGLFSDQELLELMGST